MDVLYEFLFVFDKYKSSEINAVLPLQSKVRLLFDLYKNDKINDDAQASLLIYNEARVGKKYQMLKQSLRNKLCFLLLNSHLHQKKTLKSKLSTYDEVNITLEKDLLVVKKLLSNNVYHNAIRILKKVIQSAQKHYLVEVELRATVLMRTAVSLMGNDKEVSVLNRHIQKLSKQYQLILVTIEKWETFYAKFKFSKQLKNDQLAFINQAIKSIDTCIAEFQHPYLWYYKLLLSLFYDFYALEIEGFQKNYMEFLLCLEKYSEVQNHNHYIMVLNLAAQFERLHYNTVAYQRIIEKCLLYTDYRAFDKFKIQENQFEYFLQVGDPENALQVIVEVVKTAQFQYLNPIDKSNWLLKESVLWVYLKLTNDTRSISKLPTLATLATVTEFNQNVKHCQKDKTGAQCIVMYLRLVLHYVLGKETYKEAHNLNVYLSRHLKNEPLRRTNFFCKLLVYLSNNEFEFYAVKKVQAEFEQFTKESDTTYLDTLEWIPYEVFLDLLYSFQVSIPKSTITF